MKNEIQDNQTTETINFPSQPYRVISPSISMEDVPYAGECDRIIDKPEIWWDVASVK